MESFVKRSASDGMDDLQVPSENASKTLGSLPQVIELKWPFPCESLPQVMKSPNEQISRPLPHLRQSLYRKHSAF